MIRPESSDPGMRRNGGSGAVEKNIELMIGRRFKERGMKKKP